MPVVLDSWALLAYLEDEPAADAVDRLLTDATASGDELLMTIVNWGEIYYAIMRAASQQDAERITGELDLLPLRIVGVPEDRQLARQAAVFKATRKMSYADCFAAALAKMNGLELVTGDPEFKEVEKEIRVRWLPAK